jgi:diguanylate cyclase
VDTDGALDANAIEAEVRELLRAADDLRSLGLVFQAQQSETLARREEEIRSIVMTLGETIRAVGDVHRQFNEEVGEELAQLDTLEELPPGEKLAQRLRQAVLHVGKAARQMGQQMDATAERVGKANKRIATLEQELDEARQKAEQDGLTRLYSRAALDERLRVATERGDADAPWCFLIGDMDHFKRVNDEFGHVAGDELLAKVARRLEESLRREDEIGFIARYGGEEFGIILPHTLAAEARKVAERIREAIAGSQWELTNGRGTHAVSFTISFGVAQYRPGDTPSALIQRADEALYRAKQEGRDKVVVAGS